MKLISKIQAEYENFTAALAKKTPVEVFESAYEITYKKEILMLFESEEGFLEEYYPALLEMEYPLDFLYNSWLKADVSVIDDLKDALKSDLDYHFPVTYDLKTTCHFERDISDVSYEHDLFVNKEYPKTMVQFVRGIIIGSTWMKDIFTVHHKDVSNPSGAELIRVFNYITGKYFSTYNQLLESCDMFEMQDSNCTDDQRHYWFYTESAHYNYSVRVLADKGDYNLYLFQYKKQPERRNYYEN